VDQKPKIAFFWAASCGGCEVSLVNLHERILDIDANFEVFFCPCLVDTKKKDIENLADKELAITFFNGAIRNDENEEMAHLLRKKSKILIAYGACAMSGGIPALSNLSSKEDHLRTIYLDNPSVDNPGGFTPQEKTRMPEAELCLPAFHSKVKALHQVVPVDLFFPGCPPESAQLGKVVDLVLSGAPLPKVPSVVGAGSQSVCDECRREKGEKKIKQFFRTWEIEPDPQKCLLDQGIICMGVATRDGCGALCPKVNMPCIGCYGSPDGVLDQGAKMAATLGGMLDIEEIQELPEEQIPAAIMKKLKQIPDLAGIAYKFSLSSSILKKKIDHPHE
jgi:F420-non-reducing hydrogenase small subunit